MWFVYSKFKLRKWKRYSSQKRLRILQALEDKMARKQHRDPIDVVVHERSDWNCLGMFTYTNNETRIYIHEKLILDISERFTALETIIHEGRHATQYIIAFKENIPWWRFKAKRWKKNFAGYISSNDDKLLYNTQEVERDAQKYTIKMLRKLEYKYRYEEDFYKTLERNEYRYNKADEDAKEKYGMFYKFKMHRKINKLSKNK